MSNSIQHTKIRHVDIKLLAIRERVQSGQVSLKYIEGEELEADIMTKALAAPRHAKLCALIKLGVMIMVSMMCVSGGESFKIKVGELARSNKLGPYRLGIKLSNPCPMIETAIGGAVRASIKNHSSTH